MHGQERSIEDVDFIYFLRAHLSDGPGQGGLLDYLPRSVAIPFAELLGVVEQRMGKIFRQDDGGGEDRAGQATPPRFIAACFH